MKCERPDSICECKNCSHMKDFYCDYFKTNKMCYKCDWNGRVVMCPNKIILRDIILETPEPISRRFKAIAHTEESTIKITDTETGNETIVKSSTYKEVRTVLKELFEVKESL